MSFSAAALCGVLFLNGCNHQEASAPPPAQQQQQSQAIQNDPNIPPAVKAIRERQMQDNGPPQRPPAAPSAH